MKARAAVAILVAAASLGTVGAEAGPERGRYGPPYEPGHEGGDEANFVAADPESGRVTVFRVYLFPGGSAVGAAEGSPPSGWSMRSARR